MEPDDVLEMLRDRPFRQFRISLSDGQQFVVRHPDLLMVGQSRLIIGIPASDGPEGVFDRTVNCALLNITSLEPLDAAPAVEY